MSKSSIEWTTRTWNPVTGCMEVSPGCKNCYARGMSARLAAMGQEKYKDTTRKAGKATLWTGKINLSESDLAIPLTVKTPSMFFVNSMSDIFHADVPFSFIDKIFETIRACPQHIFQILTKRPEIMRDYANCRSLGHFPANTWLGVSVENQETTGRIDYLLDVPGVHRFISAEPLLEEIDITSKFSIKNSKLDWVICGGESGNNARPIKQEWVMDLYYQCQGAGFPFFFKQWGNIQSNPAGRYDITTDPHDPNHAKGGCAIQGRIIREMPKEMQKIKGI
jgi:protein gp37